MIAGDQIAVGVVLYDGGATVSYATITAARSAGWSFLFYDMAGVLLATQPTITLSAPTVATATRSRTSNVATVVTTSDHNLQPGQMARVSGLGGTGYNAGSVLVASVPTTTSFTYASTGINETTTADTGGLVRADDGYHSISFALPSGQWMLRVVPPQNGSATPQAFIGEGDAYDMDSIGSLVNAGSRPADPAEPTANSSLTIYDGNSILVDVSVSDTALAYVGAAALSGVTLAGAIKLTSKNSPDAADVTFTPTIVFDTTGNRVVRCRIDAFPAALAVPAGAQSISARLDVRLTSSGRTVTGATVQLTIAWKAST